MQVMHVEGDRLMVGLTGYPNVGKSSTINALFGAKKTAVAPTPGKTKHFQTLNVSDNLTLCDCPGLVIPKYAASKAEMVAAGAHSGHTPVPPTTGHMHLLHKSNVSAHLHRAVVMWCKSYGHCGTD